MQFLAYRSIYIAQWALDVDIEESEPIKTVLPLTDYIL